jgi:hypothetical protein
MEQGEGSCPAGIGEAMRIKIVKGRTFNHRNGQSELDLFRKKVKKEMRKCRCKYCREREAWRDLSK